MISKEDEAKHKGIGVAILGKSAVIGRWAIRRQCAHRDTKLIASNDKK